MSKILKLFKGYNDNEIKMSSFLSASPSPPSEAELAEMYKLFKSTYRNFADLNLVLNRHIVALDHSVKFYRGILFLAHTLNQLYPLRNDGICEDLAELDLNDSQPIPPASLFLHLRVQALDSIDTLKAVQYWGKRVEIAHCKKFANPTTSPSSNSNSPKDLLDQHVDPESGSRHSGDRTSANDLLGATRSSDTGGPLLGELSTPRTDSTPAVSTSLHTSDQGDAAAEGADPNSIDSADQSKFVRPPGVFITGLYELYTKHNISIQAETQRFINQLQSYSLSTDTSGQSLQQIDFSPQSADVSQHDEEFQDYVAPNPIVPIKPPPRMHKRAPSIFTGIPTPLTTGNHGNTDRKNAQTAEYSDSNEPLLFSAPQSAPPRLKDKHTQADQGYAGPGAENGGYIFGSESVQLNDPNCDLVVFNAATKSKKR